MIAELEPKLEQHYTCSFFKSPDPFRKLEAQIVCVVKQILHDVHKHDFKI